MTRFIFADEAGNFDFSRGQGASRYFILTTVTMDDCDIGPELLDLRRQMVRDGLSVEGELHASTDAQAVRDRVFDLITANGRLRIDATILDKPKAEPKVRPDDVRFYKYGWYYHFKYVAPKLGIAKEDDVLLTAASLGTARKRKAFREAVDEVVSQIIVPPQKYRLAFWSAASDPCLQVADYCCWAIQRKWELGDDRSYQLIRPLIATEYDLWSVGRRTFY